MGFLSVERRPGVQGSGLLLFLCFCLYGYDLG